MHTKEQDEMTGGFMGALKSSIEEKQLRDAAPDMLEALKATKNVFESAHLPGGEEFVEYQMICSAIAKAEGW